MSDELPTEGSDLTVGGDVPASAGFEQIGAYTLIRTLGEGGMGTVYLAEQKTPVERRVALKVIKLGMDTREVVARFEAERQALAVMDHPGIARVFDGGATDTGRPFFAMEFVQGEPITQFADRTGLRDSRARRAGHRRLPRRAARAPEGHHPSRSQAVERAGDAAGRHGRRRRSSTSASPRRSSGRSPIRRSRPASASSSARPPT